MYLNVFDDVYTTGDGAHRDADGEYTITGRMDDVINVSGHRLGTAEIEDCLVRRLLFEALDLSVFEIRPSWISFRRPQ